MEEESIRKGAIRTAKCIRVVMIFIGMVLILTPIVLYSLSGDSRPPIRLELIERYFWSYGLTGLISVLMGEYLYFHLVAQAFIAYNSRRMTDSCDVIESGIRRMAGLGYGQNVRPTEPVNPQGINMQGMNTQGMNTRQ